MKWLFLPLPAGKPWNGATIYTDSLGGSESAVAYTALALHNLGEDVTVMTHGTAEPTTIEGVKYVPMDQGGYYFNQELNEEWDVVVSSRWPDAIAHPWKAEHRVLWFHDLPQDQNQGFPVNITKFVCLTEYHRAAWGFPSGYAIIGNGVDIKIFEQVRNVPRDENKLVWISNPDRGLALAAKIFQEIRKRWPDLELHVYGRSSIYGWGPEMEAPYLPRKEHMENIFLYRPLAKAALARELASAWAMFYPTYWPETYCIAALEAQAAGTPVVASPYAGLNETIEGGILSYDFLNSISQLRNKRRWSKLSEAGIEHARQRSWDMRAKEWLNVFAVS